VYIYKLLFICLWQKGSNSNLHFQVL